MIDTTTLEFRAIVDVGVAASGVVTMRGTIYKEQNWVDLESLGQDPVVAAGGQSVHEFLAEQEADPVMAAALARARKRVDVATAPAEGGGIAALRRKAGMSQRQLAEIMGTQQPAIARWERNPDQMTGRTMREMANALGISAQAIMEAAEQTYVLDGVKVEALNEAN